MKRLGRLPCTATVRRLERPSTVCGRKSQVADGVLNGPGVKGTASRENRSSKKIFAARVTISELSPLFVFSHNKIGVRNRQMDLATCFGKEVVSIMWPERIESRHLKIISVDVVDGNFF